MHKIAPLILVGLLGCGEYADIELAETDDTSEFRGTRNGTYQLVMTRGSFCPIEDPHFVLDGDMCCPQGPTGETPCWEPDVSGLCQGPHWRQAVCIVDQERLPEDSWICFGDEECRASGDWDEDCWYGSSLSDSGVWHEGWICLDVAPTCAGGGGDAEPGECETGN